MKVKSSTVDTITYDPHSHVMTVTYLTGHVYQYSGVTDSEYKGCLTAPSVGKHLNKHIKPMKRTMRKK